MPSDWMEVAVSRETWRSAKCGNCGTGMIYRMKEGPGDVAIAMFCGLSDCPEWLHEIEPRDA